MPILSIARLTDLGLENRSLSDRLPVGFRQVYVSCLKSSSRKNSIHSQYPSMLWLPQSHLPERPRHQGRQRIRYLSGFWWFFRPANNQEIVLDRLFGRCNWRVDRLCAHLGIGKRTFSRMVEEDLGIKSKLWLRQIRIVRACHLLREECKIEHVAQKLGFRQLSDFDRDFRKLVGVSPTFYRDSERSRSEYPGWLD